MLSSPIGAVVAVRDVAAAVRFFGRLGMRETGSGALPADLYGDAGGFVDLAAADRGRLRIVEVAAEPAARGPFDHGPIALDFYTRTQEQDGWKYRHLEGRKPSFSMSH